MGNLSNRSDTSYGLLCIMFQVPPIKKSGFSRIFLLEVPGGLEPPYSVLQTDT